VTAISVYLVKTTEQARGDLRWSSMPRVSVSRAATRFIAPAALAGSDNSTRSVVAMLFSPRPPCLPAVSVQRTARRLRPVGAAASVSPAAAAALALLLQVSGTFPPDLYAAGADTAAAVAALASPAEVLQLDLRAYDGVWEVAYAPHIRSLSEPLGVRVRPLRYTLHDGRLRSDVRYSSPVFGSGWLCAEGPLEQQSAGTVDVLFSSFWWRPGDEDVPPERGATLLDSAVDAVGRAAFFPSLSRFPVVYADGELAVFRFPPLRATIAALRVAG